MAASSSEASLLSQGVGSRFYLTTLVTLAVSFMLYQIALLRELRFQLMTLFTLAPFLFSSVIACIAAGSLCADKIRARTHEVLRWATVLLPLIALPVFTVAIKIAQAIIQHPGDARFAYGGSASSGAGDAYLSSSIFAFIAVAIFGYGIVFFLQGLIFSLYFREGRQEGTLSNVYGADLVASGLGALLGGLLTFFCTPIEMAILSTALFVANIWLSFRPLGIRLWLAAGASLLTAGLAGGELAGHLLSRLEASSSVQKMTHSLWSRYRRIDARESSGKVDIYTDGLLFQAFDQEDRLHLGDPRNLTALVAMQSERPVRDILIIGGGTGADVRVLRDLLGPSPHIVAVEIDEKFVAMARNFPWIWQYYSTAQIVTEEGRYFLENEHQDFDMVMYSFVDPQSTIGTVGVPDANFLYTDAGLRAAYARVRSGGTLVISRVYLVQEQEEFVRRMCATLQSAGIPPESVSLSRRKWSVAWGYYGQLSALHVVVQKGSKAKPLPDPRLVSIPWSPSGRPTTDLYPFSLGTGVWFDTLLGYVRRNVLPLVIVCACLLSIAGATVTSLSRSTFFVLGFGSFLLESLVLFNSFLLFGDPNLSAALAVGMFLLWGGLGSLLSPRWEHRRWLYLAVPATVVLYAVTAPLLNAATITTPATWRCLALFVHLCPVGTAAGMMFPIALRRFQDRSVPGMFFMDVVGCALAPPVFWLAISLTGVWLVMAGAAVSYALVSVVLLARS